MIRESKKPENKKREIKRQKGNLETVILLERTFGHPFSRSRLSYQCKIAFFDETVIYSPLPLIFLSLAY